MAHQSDVHTAGAGADLFHHLRPLGQVRFPGLNAQLSAYHCGKIGFFQHEGRFVEIGQGQIFDDAVRLYIAEHGDLLEYGLIQRYVAPEHDDIRGYAHALEFLDRMLGRLCLVLFGAFQERHQSHMDEKAVFPADFQ